jgi:DNA-binding winged helix-turn-helix (wHTH) protein
MKEPDAKPAKCFYSFGPFRFYPKERELFREGEPVSLAPRATDTLLHLVSRRGHVVDKNELLTSVWGETFVEEANVAHQVGHLRRMLGETPEGNPYIETIPRRGYRFSARVTESWEEGETAGGPVLIEDQARVGKRQQREWRPALSGVSLIVVLGGLIGIYLLLLKKQDLPEMAARPLTTYPGNEAWPSFSPDGSQVAFGWKREKRDDFDIHVAVVGSDKALQLTDTPDWDIGPVWSPDGGQIAFDRSRRDGWHGIYVVSPLGEPGTSRGRIEGAGLCVSLAESALSGVSFIVVSGRDSACLFRDLAALGRDSGEAALDCAATRTLEGH